MRLPVAPIALAGLLVAHHVATESAATAVDHSLFEGIHDGKSLTASVQERLDRAKGDIETLQSPDLQGIERLRLYDAAQIELESADSLSLFIARVSPDGTIRAAAQAAGDTVSAFANDLALNRQVFDALKRIDPGSVDAGARFFLTRTLATYRRAGVDFDSAKRRTISARRTTIDTLSRQFTANIESGTRTLRVPAAQLRGLPDEFVKTHPPTADGMVALTTAAADAGPTLSYASDTGLRRDMFVAVNNVGYPANAQVLAELRKARFELAQLLGYRAWSEYDVSDRMAESGGAVEQFLRAIDQGTRPLADRELRLLLDRKRRDEPDAQAVEAWDADYYTELVRRDLAPNSGAFRLPYDVVESGVLRVASQLFDLSFTPAHVSVWDSSVKAFEIRQADKPIGRVYLDMYVRPNKRNRGAGTVALRSGTATQLPEVALIAGFGGGPGQSASLSHAEMRTFFHEFGHVLHFVLGGRQAWSGLDAVHAERDFLEAPSQMLEAWMWSPQTLALMAGTSDTAFASVEQLRAAQRAAQFGEALRERNLLFRSLLAFRLHDSHPEMPADDVTREAYTASLPYGYVADTHHYAGFTHLANPNYTSGYYTYLWSLAVAKDLEGQFDHGNLMAKAPAARYRTMVLEVGAGKPAMQILHDFLGRDFSTKAWSASIRPMP